MLDIDFPNKQRSFGGLKKSMRKIDDAAIDQPWAVTRVLYALNAVMKALQACRAASAA